MILLCLTSTAALMRKYLPSEERYGSNSAVGVPRGRTSVLNITHGMNCPFSYCDMPLYEMSFDLNSIAMSHVVLPLLGRYTLLVQNQGRKVDLVGTLSARGRRGVPSPQARSPRRHRPGAHQTNPPET